MEGFLKGLVTEFDLKIIGIELRSLREWWMVSRFRHLLVLWRMLAFLFNNLCIGVHMLLISSSILGILKLFKIILRISWLETSNVASFTRSIRSLLILKLLMYELLLVPLRRSSYNLTRIVHLIINLVVLLVLKSWRRSPTPCFTFVSTTSTTSSTSHVLLSFLLMLDQHVLVMRIVYCCSIQK